MADLTLSRNLEESGGHSGDKEEFGGGWLRLLHLLPGWPFCHVLWQYRPSLHYIFISRLPVVPIKVRHRFLLCSSIQSRRDRLKWGFLRLRGTGVNQGWGFVWVEGAVVIRPHGAMVSRGSSVVRHPSEVLWMPSSPLVVVRGAVLIRTPPLRVRMSEIKKIHFSATALHATKQKSFVYNNKLFSCRC